MKHLDSIFNFWEENQSQKCPRNKVWYLNNSVVESPYQL